MENAGEIITYFGANAQMDKLTEELGELVEQSGRLIKNIRKHKDGKGSNLEELIEEMWDVKFLCTQFEMAFAELWGQVAIKKCEQIGKLKYQIMKGEKNEV